MPNSSIYVFENGSHDYSRWLNISLRPGRVALFQLSDLCHPGMLSGLKSVACDLELVQSSLRTGTLQVTVPQGYFVASRAEDLLHIEFKSYDDVNPCKVTLLASEVEARLESLLAQAATSVA